MEYTPRPYQQECIDRIIKSFENGICRQLLVNATGLGKTLTAGFLREQFQPDKKTLFLVDRIELAYQAKETFLKLNDSLNVGIEMNKHTHSPDDDVVISSIPTIGRKGSKRIKKFKPEEYAYICVDEAHKSITKSWERVLNYMQVGPQNFDNNKMLVGYTATPNRPDGKPLNYLYDDITATLDIRWGMKNGWLSDFEFIRVNTDTDITGVKKSKGKLNQTQLDKAVNNGTRNEQIFKAYKEYADGEPALAYGSSVDHSIIMAELFTKNGVPSECIHANTPKHKRKKWLQDFREEKLKVIWNHSTMTTGVDLPDASTCILGRPIGSNLLYQQIVGRILRPATDSFVDLMNDAEERQIAMQMSSKPVAKIIDFHDVTKDKQVCSASSLFGYHPGLIPEKKQRFYKDVVENLDQIEHEHQIDVSKIKNLDEIELQIERQKSDLGSVLNIPRKIQLHSNKNWVEINEHHYEISYGNENIVMMVVENQLDMWELKLHNLETKETDHLNTFGSFSGAVNVGDQYGDENLDTSFTNSDKWEEDGITQPQMKYLKQLLKYDEEFRIDKSEQYKDTRMNVCYYCGERLNKGKASRLLTRLFDRQRKEIPY
jgi:superfamily II DNA or RNA helicase